MSPFPSFVARERITSLSLSTAIDIAMYSAIKNQVASGTRRPTVQKANVVNTYLAKKGSKHQDISAMQQGFYGNAACCSYYNRIIGTTNALPTNSYQYPGEVNGVVWSALSQDCTGHGNCTSIMDPVWNLQTYPSSIYAPKWCF